MQSVLTFERTLPAESGSEPVEVLEKHIATSLPAGSQLLRWAVVGVSETGEAYVEGAFLTPLD